MPSLPDSSRIFLRKSDPSLARGGMVFIVFLKEIRRSLLINRSA
jgi:hypothetical protein